MRKVCIYISVFALIAITAVASFFAPVMRPATVKASSGVYSLSVNDAIGAMNVMPTSITEDPNDKHTGAVYTKNENTGKEDRVYYLEDVGLTVISDGNGGAVPVAVSDGANTLAIVYEEDTKEFIDGVMNPLAIFLDSHVERQYLKSGSNYTVPIRMDNEVLLINYVTSTSKMIYAFRRERKLSFWEKLNPFNGGVDPYSYFDMNGAELDKDKIEDFGGSGWAKAGLTIAKFIGWPITPFFAQGMAVDYAKVYSRTTLAELMFELEYTTSHPWKRLFVDADQTIPVVTEDGVAVRVNPRTKQLCDTFGWALFNSSNGLPIVYYENDIITTNRQQQVIENAVLKDSMTVQKLLNTGTEFYIDTITILPYGTFDVPVYMNSKGETVLMNGQSTDGITNGIQDASGQDGEQLGDILNDIGTWLDGAFSSGSGFMNMLKMVCLVLILIMLFPLIPPLIKFISVPFAMLSDSIKTLSKKRKSK
jgi:hypothetical protein